MKFLMYTESKQRNTILHLFLSRQNRIVKFEKKQVEKCLQMYLLVKVDITYL